MSEPDRAHLQPRPRAAAYAKGRRRVSIYISWSYPAEANRDTAELDNRFSTMTEVRRVAWPAYEVPRLADPLQFQQGIAGSLELFFWAWVPFQRLVGRSPATPSRCSSGSTRRASPCRSTSACSPTPTRCSSSAWTTTSPARSPSTAEIEALRGFLEREGTCLVIGPHHDVGASDDLDERALEYAHHGDPLVPRQQRFGRYTRGAAAGPGDPGREPLRPAPGGASRDRQQGRAARRPCATSTRGAGSQGVESLNFHMHLPHYAVTRDDGTASGARATADRPVAAASVHAGGRDGVQHAGLGAAGRASGPATCWSVDSTVFSTLFGGDESLERFWKNIALAS